MALADKIMSSIQSSYENNNITKNEPKLPEWFGKDIQPKETTPEEQAEMEKVMAELESLL